MDMDIDYIQIKRFSKKYYELAEDYLLEVNWGYVNIGLFCALLVFYTIDSLTGSQISPVFLVVVLFILLILGFIVMSVFAGMS